MLEKRLGFWSNLVGAAGDRIDIAFEWRMDCVAKSEILHNWTVIEMLECYRVKLYKNLYWYPSALFVAATSMFVALLISLFVRCIKF